MPNEGTTGIEDIVRRNIAALRAKEGLTQQGLAQEVGCSQANISLLERGITTPSPDLAKKLACRLGMNIEQVLFPAKEQEPK